MKAHIKRVSVIILALLIACSVVACGEDDPPRVEPVITYSPGAVFSTNFNHDDPRRQIKCAIMFEVLDEEAVLELEAVNYRVRNAVLSVLSELTMDELTTNRNQDAIAARIVERVNYEVGASIGRSDDIIHLVISAYFTEFAVV